MTTWRTLTNRKSKRTAPNKRPTNRPSNRLAVEPLEHRWLLANFTVLNSNDSGAGSLRQAILDSNANPGADLIAFNIAAADANHLYYQDDGVAGQVSAANIAVTSASDDTTITDIDPDHSHSWWSIKPTSVLPIITGPTTIDGYTQAGSSVNTLSGGLNTVLRIELNGSLAGSTPTMAGLDFGADDSTVRGLSINSIAGAQIRTGGVTHAANFVAEGNFIGVDPSGLRAGTNQGRGLGIVIGVNGRIGTDADGLNDLAERNLISGGTFGISLSGGTGYVVAGNLVGTDITGTRAIPNVSLAAITVQHTGLTIGGTSEVARNVVSGNFGNGISITNSGGGAANIVQGNFVGVDVTGTRALGNSGFGIGYSANPGATYNVLIGGTTPAERNVISGNGGGIGLSNRGTALAAATVQGNYIGTDVTGMADLGNVATGISMRGLGAQIGGSAPGAGNLISGNGQNGVSIGDSLAAATDVRVEGNRIGTNADGTGFLGNSQNGVLITTSSTANVVGGTGPGAGNIIAGNTLDGVRVASGTGNSIRGNSIYSNGQLGIDLDPNNPTPNDAGDADTGPNDRQNFPLISSVYSSASSTFVQGSLNSTANTTFTLDFYANVTADPSGFGEGQTYLGSTLLTTDASGNATFTATLPVATSAGQFVSATTTDPNGSTSEFSGLATSAFFEPATITGTKYHDLNGNGIRDGLSVSSGAITVPGTSDPWLAGMPDGSTASSGDVAPDESPVLVPMSLTVGAPLTFDVTGCVHNGPSGCSVNNPDSGPATNAHFAGAENGISSVTAPTNSLIGVFLGPNQPNLSSAPTALNFSTAASRDFVSLAPVLQQTFFIGDGRTSTSQIQEFIVPAGATRLFLGTMDGFGWFNNSGAFTVTVNSSTQEPPLPNWTIELDAGADGSVDASDLTDANGQYSFTTLWPNTYRVREVQQPGWTQTSVDPADMVVGTSGQVFAGVDFGNRETVSGSTITGIKFYDLDGSGTQQIGEPVLAHWPIFLDTNGDGLHTIGEPFTYTGLNGTYSFTDLDPGTYRVREVQQPGWTQTTANPADITITANGQVFANVDFGNDRDNTTLITGTKFNDLNGDGDQDVGEGGLAHWPIFVDANQNDVYDVGEPLTFTNIGGQYAIAGLPVGSYSIREIQRPGWTQTTANPADVVVTADGQTLDGGDFGNQRDATTLITGRKFFDADSDGIADPGEPGLRYWPIFLDTNGDGTHQSGEPLTWTGWNGEYSFSGVAPGTYRVREIQQPGWTQTTANPADVVVTADGQTFENIDFGNKSSRSGPGYEPPTDLDISKDAPRAVAGEQITYTLRVTNKGPADSYGVILGDQLAPGLIFESVTPSQGTCRGGQTVICALGPLAVGETATVTIVAHVLSWVQVEVDNEGCVYSTATDINPADNCAIAKTPIDTDTDLELVKTADGLRAIAGRDLTYTLRVTNNGPSDSTNVELEDELPPDVSFVSAESTHGSCVLEVTAVNTVVCELGTVANGETAIVTLVVHVGPWVPEDAIITNTARVRDPHGGSGEGIIRIPCGRSVDVELNKTGPFTTVDAQVYYVIEVTNHGPSNSAGPIVGDDLPDDINFLYAVASQGFCNQADPLVCNLGPMVVGQTETVTVFVGVPETVVIGDVRNEAVVHPPEGDPNPDNNFGGTGGIRPIFGLGIVKSAPPEIPAGEYLTYTLEVTNKGPDDASNVIVGDTIPAGLILISATPSQGTCYTFFNPILCFLGAMEVGDVETVEIVVFVPPSIPEGTVFVNTGYGWSGIPPVFGEATTRVFRKGDIELEKIAPPEVPAGTEMTYTLRTRNRGPSDSTNITLEDVLPPEVEFRSATPSQGTCSDTEDNGQTTVSCALGDIPSGGVAEVEIVVFVPSFTADGVVIENGACVTAFVLDPDLTNNCDVVHTGVSEVPDLEVIKTSTPGPITAGENIEYTLEVHNRGPSDARSVILGDTLPAGVVFVSATATQGTCEYTGGAVICNIGRVVVGQHEFVTIVAFVPPTTPDGTVIENTGCIIECGHDPFHDNDCGTVRNTIRALSIITGIKFNDLDGDGVRDADEPGIEGWRIFLDLDGDNELDPNERSVTTDASGRYTFAGVGKATWYVREVQNPDWIQTTPNPDGVTVTGLQQTYAGGDFGNFKKIAIGGRVYHDHDRDGTLDPSEPGLGGWLVIDDPNNNGILDPGEQSTISDPGGDYRFDDLGPGTHIIRELPPADWIVTTPNPAPPIVARSGDDRTGIDFGNARDGVPGKITGGGSIDERVRNLGFVVMPKTQGGVMTFFGNLEFQDKALGYNFKSTTITSINIEPDRIHGQFSGTATLNGVAGYRFFVELEDRAEPGALIDKFRIQITGPGGFSYDSNTYATRGGILDKGGNIQIHKPGSSLTSGTGSTDDSSDSDLPLVISAGQLLQGVVTVAVEDPTSAIDTAQRDRIDDALTTLNETFAPFGLTLTETTGSDETGDIRLIVDSNSPCGSSADGVLGCTSDSNTITLLVGWNWYTGADEATVGSGQYDYQTIVTHELGHALGLGHSHDSDSVMYSVLSTGVARRNLTANDLSGADDDDEDGYPEALVATGFANPTGHDSMHERRNGGGSANDDHVQVLDTFAIAPDRSWQQSLDDSSDSSDDVLIGGDGDDLEIGDTGQDRLVGGIAGGRWHVADYEVVTAGHANESNIHDAALDGVLEDWELLTVE